MHNTAREMYILLTYNPDLSIVSQEFFRQPESVCIYLSYSLEQMCPVTCFEKVSFQTSRVYEGKRLTGWITQRGQSRKGSLKMHVCVLKDVKLCVLGALCEFGCVMLLQR